MPPDDAALVRRARAGDRSAFAALVARHSALLTATTRRAAGDDDLAADAAQEAVLTALLSLDRLRDDSAFGAWLAGIGLNATRHLHRDRRRTTPLPSDAGGWLRTTPLPDAGGWLRTTPLPDEGGAAEQPDLDRVLDDQRAAARIRRAIATLPAGQREAVALFYLAGLTHAEAAEHLGVPIGAVKTRLHKARANLKRRLDPLWKEQYAVSDLVPMHVTEVRRSADGAHHLIMLSEAEPGRGRQLPIWVGTPEAFAIAGLLERIELPRPGPYDFAAALLHATGAAITEVRISRLAESVFYADVVLQDGTTVDARPSDAIALALREEAPIRVVSAVLDQTERDGVPGGPAGALATASVEFEDQRVLAAETRERLARQAAELRGP